MRHHEVEVMGTVVTFDLFDERGFDERALSDAFKRAGALLYDADKNFSTWKSDSPMNRLRRGELAVDEAPAVIRDVLDRCREARRLSGGWFDPWAMPGGVDPTGYVKGWAAQSSLGILATLGATGAIVNAAGDVAVAGGPTTGTKFRVGIVNPFDTTSIAGVVEVSEAIATSGDYERGAHLVNPFTGSTESSLASATVCGADLGLCDALATALVVGGDHVMALIGSLDGYEALGIARDATWMTTSGFALSSPISL